MTVVRWSVESSDPDVLWLLGQDAHEQGDLALALRYWRQAAELGNIFAAVQGGLTMEDSDPGQAVAWYQQVNRRDCWGTRTRAEHDAVQLANARLDHLNATRRRQATP